MRNDLKPKLTDNREVIQIEGVLSHGRSRSIIAKIIEMFDLFFSKATDKSNERKYSCDCQEDSAIFLL